MTIASTTTERKPAVDFGFPSHMIPPQKKDKKWHLQYTKAFHKEFTTGTGKILRWAADDYDTWRLYANGKQPIDQYKELMGIRKRKGRRDPSWLNLDWSILSVMPRIKAVVKNKILSEPYEIMIKAIDQISMTEERKRRAEIIGYLADRQFSEEATQNLPIEPVSPFEPGEPVPENIKEVDLYLQMFPKNRMTLEMLDQINLSFSLSDWKQMREEILDNMFDVGIAGTRTYIDNRGVIRMRSIVPERMITNACTKKDFSDLIRIGEYIDMTISELRQRVPRGTFSEKDYAEMASKASNKAYEYDSVLSLRYYNENNRYPWDHERITVLDAEWFSADDVATIIDKDEMGRVKLIKKDDPYWLQKQGITDDQYTAFQKKNGKERELVRDSVNNVYKACWVVGTEFIFDWGMQNNMIRSISSLNDCETGYTLYTLNFGSMMEQAIPVCNDIQKNWLLYQHYTASAKPPGVAIERRAITQVTIGSGKTAITMTPEDILKQYSETGSYIYVGTDQNGKPYPFDPIKELKGGVSEQAAQCLDNIIRNIDLLRGVIGLNEFTDATSPDARANKDILNEAVANTNNALGTLIHSYVSIYERTAKKVCLLVPDAEGMGRNPGKIEALGDLTHDFFRMNIDRNFVDYSLTIDLGITKEMKARLTLYVQQSMKSAANPQGILPEDAWLIENETNIHRAYQILAQKRRLREAEDFERQKALIDQQAQSQGQMAMQLEMMKQKTLEQTVKATIIQEQMKGQIMIQVKERELAIQAMMTKLQMGETLKEKEMDWLMTIVEKQMDIAGKVKVAQIQGQNQIAAVKAQPKPAPSASK